MTIKKICLVDDTTDLLRNLAQFLEMEGYEVWPYENGHDALERLKTETPHLIITDLWMPEMEGTELIRAVRSMLQLKNVPIAVFSAKPFQEYEAKVKIFNKMAYIKKPATLDEILTVVNELLAIS